MGVREGVEVPEVDWGSKAGRARANARLGKGAPAANQRPLRSLTLRECSNVRLEVVFVSLPRFSCAAPSQRSCCESLQDQTLGGRLIRAPIATATLLLQSH